MSFEVGFNECFVTWVVCRVIRWRRDVVILLCKSFCFVKRVDACVVLCFE